MTRRHLILATVVASFFMLPALADAADIKQGTLIIRQAWSRATVASVSTGVVYLEIDNTGLETDRLTNVSSPAASMAHLHSTEMQGEMSSMKPMAVLEIPAGGKVILKPQAQHIMLMGLAEPLKKGATFPVVLTFEKAGSVQIDVPIESAGALGPTED